MDGWWQAVSNNWKNLKRLENSCRCFPEDSVGKETYKAVDLGLIPGSGRSPGEGTGNPLQYICLENPMDGGAWWATVQFSTGAQSCPTLCDPMNCSMPGLPVNHHLPEFTQTHVHRVSDASQPSHPWLSTSPPAPNPSQHQSLFQWVSSHVRWPKYWSFSFSIIPSKQISGLISFRMDWLDLACLDKASCHMESCYRERSTGKEVMNELSNSQEENETLNPIAWQDLTLQTVMCA